MSVKVYIKGGGVGESSLTKCREGFRTFLERLLPGKGHIRVVACGGRSEAFKRFRTAHQGVMPGDYVILLVDSEGPVESHVSPWDFLGKREGDEWPKPEGATDDQVHLMVQCMEAWFMADREAVVKYFNEGVKIGHLPANEDIEVISKEKITASLGKAAREVRKTRGTEKQGYDKVHDGFSLLAVINPEKVCKASRHARRLMDTLKIRLRDRP